MDIQRCCRLIDWTNMPQASQHSVAFLFIFFAVSASLMVRWDQLQDQAKIFKVQYITGKRAYHGLKYLSVSMPDGLQSFCLGPWEGCRHDCGILRLSNAMQILEDHFSHVSGSPSISLFGDMAFPSANNTIIPPWREWQLSDDPGRIAFNKIHKAVRVTVEWSFNKPLTLFALLTRTRTQQLLRSPVALQYKVSVLLSNAHTCLYGNQTSTYFNMMPISIFEYFS